jgi:uncharacterized membrane protein
MQTQQLEGAQDRGEYEIDEAWQSAEPIARRGRDDGEQHGWENGLSLREAGERRARWLGLFSMALGISQLSAPSRLSRMLGLRDSERSRVTLRLIGARELASGIGLLSKPSSAAPVWSRVAGDVIDLALLGGALADTGRARSRGRLLAATAAVAGVAALDVMSAARLSRKESIQKLALPIHVVRSITISRSPDEVYRFWRQLENLPRFMAHLESVKEEADGSSTWRAKAPAGLHVEWRAEITLDRPNEAIAWRAVEGATVPNRGVVRFEPGPAGNGTVIKVELKYDPPGGALAAAIAKLFGEEPAQQIAGDLRRLKQVLETGSVVHSDASIHRGLHAARPAGEHERTQLLGQEEAR